MLFGLFLCVPSMALILLVQVQSRVFTAKCSEPQAGASNGIVDLCRRDLAFIWLTKGQKPQRDVFYDFKGKKLTGEVLDELNYQFMRRLEKEGLITLKELYIDGTKIEANANNIRSSGGAA